MHEEMVEIQTGGGQRKVLGTVLGDLAVTREDEDALWTITHLPSGLSFGGFYFKDKSLAIEALEEFCKMRNSWDISREKMIVEREKILSIYKRLNATRIRSEASSPTYTLNGYDGNPL